MLLELFHDISNAADTDRMNVTIENICRPEEGFLLCCVLFLPQRVRLVKVCVREKQSELQRRTVTLLYGFTSGRQRIKTSNGDSVFHPHCSKRNLRDADVLGCFYKSEN